MYHDPNSQYQYFQQQRPQQQNNWNAFIGFFGILIAVFSLIFNYFLGAPSQSETSFASPIVNTSQENNIIKIENFGFEVNLPSLQYPEEKLQADQDLSV